MNATEQTIKKSAKQVSSRSNQHTVYKTASGERVPGATTIVGIREKPALKIWANKIGLAGIEINKYVDELAGVGSLAHLMVLDHLRGEKTDTSEFSPKQVELAENSFLSFLEWARTRAIRVVQLETPLVSETLRYGGTPDCVAFIDGILELIEFKTGGIWPEHFIQLAAYSSLLIENGVIEEPIERYRVLSIPRAETEAFAEQTKQSVKIELEIFKHLLAVYGLERELKNG